MYVCFTLSLSLSSVTVKRFFLWFLFRDLFSLTVSFHDQSHAVITRTTYIQQHTHIHIYTHVVQHTCTYIHTSLYTRTTYTNHIYFSFIHIQHHINCNLSHTYNIYIRRHTYNIHIRSSRYTYVAVNIHT